MVRNIPGTNPVNNDYFLEDDVVSLAKGMLGMRLVTLVDGVLTSGIISETEAYGGATDKASHAYGGRHTKRTRIMYEQGGCIYVFLCYGIHSLFNIVTNVAGIPDAVLVRGIIPDEGVETMKQRRNMKNERLLANGPGKLSQAMAIHYRYSGLELNQQENGFKVWIEEGRKTDPDDIITDVRVGIDYAEEDALLPWRFILKKAHFKKK